MAEIRNDGVGNVVEVVVDIDDGRERGHFVTVDKCVGDGIARRKTARHRHEVVGDELTPGLRFDPSDDIGNGHPVHWVACNVAACAKCRLEGDAANCRMLDRELDDSAYLVLVDSALYGGDDRGAPSDLGGAVQCPPPLR